MSGSRDATVAGVVESCVAHLQKQQSLLDELLCAVRLVRHGLSTRDNEGLRKALAKIEELAEPMRVLHNQRGSLRRCISRTLEVPFQQATVQALIQRASETDRSRLEALRASTERLASEIDQCNRGNSIWIRKSLEYYGWIFQALSVSKSGGNRYAFDGQIEKPTSRPIVQVKG